MEKSVITSGLFWKLLERFGVQISQFVLQIVLARLLNPTDYGVLSLMVIFTNIANIMVQSGLNTALVQNKDVTEDDYSSVFWVSLIISIILYVGLFFLAPYISNYYDMPMIIKPFRVLALVLLPGAFNSVQLAIVSREVNFKIVFYSNLAAIVVSGATGVLLAYKGVGVWALVLQVLINACMACLVMWFTVKWRPKFKCSFVRIRVLFSFGWKLMISNLIDTLYQNLQSLVVGKKYNSSTLAFFNRGKQFPDFIVGSVNGSIQSVMLPVLSKEQDDKNRVKYLMRRSLTLSAYIIFPIMAGLAAVSNSLVNILLTSKWIFCVPYLRIYCFVFALYPVHTCNLQAINAMGRSDIFLKLEIIKKVYGIIALVIAVVCFKSPIAIAMTSVVTMFLSMIVNSYPNKKLIDYSYIEQLKDIFPSFIISVIMFIVVWSIEIININIWLTLILQIVCGVSIYVLLSYILKIETFGYLVNFLKEKRK